MIKPRCFDEAFKRIEELMTNEEKKRPG